MSRPNTRYSKEKKRLKQKLRKALAHLRKVKSGTSGTTLVAFSLLRKIAIIKQKMAVNMKDPGHILDVAHGEAVAMNKVWTPPVELAAAA